MDSNYFKNLLHDRGLKATTIRLNMLAKIKDYKSAMPYTAIHKSMNSIDRVTLYRTLQSLMKKGIIHKAFHENNEVYYAICNKECSESHHNHNHIHFKCLRCECVTCERTSEVVEISIQGVEMHKISIHVEGICKLCIEKRVDNFISHS